MKSEKEIKNNLLKSTVPALSMLQEWLSISESQICSTEVLSEQLPQVNALLESSMNSISTHFGKITDNSKKIEQEIKYIDKTLEMVHIGQHDIEMTEHLLALAAATTDKSTAIALKNLVNEMRRHEKDLHAELEKATDAIKDNMNEITQVVVNMQFQDRISQNIVITVNIMKTIVSYLEKEILQSLPEVSKEERKKLLDKDFAKEILSQFRLGELQLSFVKHLLNHGYIEDAAELGFSIAAHEKQENSGDVDLF